VAGPELAVADNPGGKEARRSLEMRCAAPGAVVAAWRGPAAPASGGGSGSRACGHGSRRVASGGPSQWLRRRRLVQPRGDGLVRRRSVQRRGCGETELEIVA
jgi:hypothetical protein